MTNSNFSTLVNIISNSTSDDAAIKEIENTFKNAGVSGSKIIFADAKDLAEGRMSEAEFKHRFEERIA